MATNYSYSSYFFSFHFYHFQSFVTIRLCQAVYGKVQCRLARGPFTNPKHILFLFISIRRFIEWVFDSARSPTQLMHNKLIEKPFDTQVAWRHINHYYWALINWSHIESICVGFLRDLLLARRHPNDFHVRCATAEGEWVAIENAGVMRWRDIYFHFTPGKYIACSFCLVCPTYEDR